MKSQPTGSDIKTVNDEDKKGLQSTDEIATQIMRTR